MTTKKWLVAAGSSAVLALGVAACGDDSSDTTSASGGGTTAENLSGEIAGAGASSQEAAQEAWIAGFQDANPDVTISYDPVGSGGGREQFIAGGVAYAGSDSSLADEELTGAEKNCGGAANLVQIPAYVSPIAVIYNLPDVTDLNLTPDLVAQIFAGDITTWNDEAIAKENPDASLPDTQITPVHRSDDSGTTANFTDYLADASSSWKYPADDTWPIKSGESAEGTSGVVEAVTAGDGAIGYADASQAGDLGIANIQIGSDFVAPSADGAAKTVEISKQDSSVGGDQYVFAYDLDRTSTESGTYPLVLVSYLIGCTQYSDSNEGAIVNGYFNYAISPDGQQAAADNAGSAPLTSAVQQEIQPAVDAIGAG